MKKFLMVLGAIALIGILVVGGTIGWAAYRASGLDRESKAFVDEAVPAIARSWNPQELLDRASPELRAKATPDQVGALFRTLAKLGPLVTYEGAKGDAKISYNTGSGSVTSAAYVANGRLQNGNAKFDLDLVKRDGRWLILNFHVEPSAAALKSL